MERHKVTQEGDEYVCSCGRRWALGEQDPHPHTAEEHIAKIKYEMKKGSPCES